MNEHDMQSLEDSIDFAICADDDDDACAELRALFPNFDT